jgi:hypothetical protein
MTDLNSLSTSTNSTSPHTHKAGLWPLQNGIVLIGLGLLFMVAAAALRSPNWWSIFIFIPALGLLWGAWLAHHFSRGAFNLWVRLNLSSGLIVLAVALIFALNLDWTYAWTLMLIVPGLVMFLNGFTHPRLRLGTELGSAANLQFWLGSSVILLGITFLLNQLGLINLHALFGNSRWWWPLILLPGLGALLNAFAVYRTTGPCHSADNFLALGVVLCVEAGAEYLGLGWRWHAPLALTLGGLTMLLASLRRN